MGQYAMQVQWLARTLRYWNKLTDLAQQWSGLLCSGFSGQRDFWPGVQQGQPLSGRHSCGLFAQMRIGGGAGGWQQWAVHP
jgi:hypothetical protein